MSLNYYVTSKDILTVQKLVEIFLKSNWFFILVMNLNPIFSILMAEI